MTQENQTNSGAKSETAGAPGATRGSDFAPVVASPDPEVVPKASRRRFSAAYKLRILETADQCQDVGAIGALLRREGLYSSHLAKWRQARREGTLQALKQSRGRPAYSEHQKASDRQIKTLEMKISALEGELDKAHTIIDIQKKLCTLLGLPTADNNKFMP